MFSPRHLVLTILLGASMVLAVPAGAESYDTTDDGLTVSVAGGGAALAGGSVTVSSSGWSANTPVTVTLRPSGDVLGTVTASSVGTVATSFTLPSSLQGGSYEIVLTGTDPSGAPRTMVEGISVEADTPLAAEGQLSFTGSSALPTAVAGAALAAGGVTVLRFRRRRLGAAA